MRTPLIILIITAFISTIIVNPAVGAIRESPLYLPVPGTMVRLSPAFNPPVLKGIKVHPDNPFRFDFILDQGDFDTGDSNVGNRHAYSIQDESTKLIKYFLASLTIPEKDLWVNLSPYEKDRIVPESFGQTEMGRDLLAQDYMLKQITASLIYPEDEIGKKFWKRIYEEAAKKFGTTNIPVNTFNKVWIVPEKAVVYENAQAGTAYVVESKLKVMLEEDYLALDKNSPRPNPPHRGEGINALGSQIVREIVIPELTKEINQGKNFAQLRQVYQSLILATWYKKKISAKSESASGGKDSILSQVYVDKNKVSGVNIDDPQEKQHIYQQYLKAFKKGVFNYISTGGGSASGGKEEQDPATQQMIPRKYFSGGFSLAMVTAYQTTTDAATITGLASNSAMAIEVVMDPLNNLNNSMMVKEKEKQISIPQTGMVFPETFKDNNGSEVIFWRGEIGSENDNYSEPVFITPDRLTAQGYKDSAGDFLGWGASMNSNSEAIARNHSVMFNLLLRLSLEDRKVAALQVNGLNIINLQDINIEQLKSNYSSFPEVLNIMLGILNDREGNVVNDALQKKVRIDTIRLSPYNYANKVGKLEGLSTEEENNLAKHYLESRRNYLDPVKILRSFHLILGKVLVVELDIDQEIIKRAKEDGYDSIWHENGVGGRQHPEIVILNPDKFEEKDVNGVHLLKPRFRDEVEVNTGGIDLTSDKALQVQNDGQGGIKFNVSTGGGSAFGGDPAMLERLQNAPGFVPVIINIQPMNDIRMFLGIKETVGNSKDVG